MGPPAEQLIRDYLNRLSVVARDRLGPDDRRALLERTRKLIERKSDFAGRPTTLEVGRVLARLGDPSVLVEQEFRRLTAVRGDPPGGAPDPAGAPQPAEPAEPADSWDLAEPAEPTGRRGLLGWARRRGKGQGWRIGSGWRASSGWPTAVPSENGTSDPAPAGPAASRLRPRRPSVVAPDGGSAPYQQPDLPVRNGTLVSAGATPADSGREGAGDERAAAANGASGMNGISTANGTAAFGTETGEEFEMPADSGVVERVARLLASVASAAWQQPLEATAIILLGLGGVIFPPVFVLGALVAVGSRLWHYRDKWAGLVLPPVLTIIAGAAGIAVGGTGHGFHDAWLALNIVSRVAALLGAGYLAWRLGSGRRPPPAPPWHKPHRVTGS